MVRLLFAMPLALASVFMLFSLMAWMVGGQAKMVSDSKPPLAFDMVMTEQESATQRKIRQAPKKPETPQAPSPQSPVAAQNVSQPVTPQTMAMSLDTAVSGIEIAAPEFGEIVANQQAMPLYRVEPNYPQKALKRGAEGYVVMSFTIDPQGRPVDIEIIEANPRRLFEREARKALARWKYQAKVMDGKAVAQPGQTVKLEFKIER
ncbi:energy transducer TonB [Vibrio sp. SCSIO 43136]|uniref:energy transducer TonB n=1 Tax=Vibrio sp. SCSIO 43136 TaxID=2819101 RepID=UPI002075DCCD|nr:energy transducer TonB [Vibrio sp. SCSIO 43136]USD67016.1 energy transducer TonB [Vibrio sp. SCSIO 43136]